MATYFDYSAESLRNADGEVILKEDVQDQRVEDAKDNKRFCFSCPPEDRSAVLLGWPNYDMPREVF